MRPKAEAGCYTLLARVGVYLLKVRGQSLVHLFMSSSQTYSLCMTNRKSINDLVGHTKFGCRYLQVIHSLHQLRLLNP